MKLLLVSHHFPPMGGAGVQRALKFARYLGDFGVEVTVLAGHDPGYLQDPALLAELPSGVAVHRVPHRTLVQRMLAMRRSAAPAVPARAAAVSASPAWREAVLGVWATLQWPDERGGWARVAHAQGRTLLRDRRFDLVMSTAPPMSAHVLARALAREAGLPWVADYRDLWADNPAYRVPRWRRALDRHMESRWLRDAAGVVTVTPSWQRRFAAQLGDRCPVAWIPNGYDEADFAAASDAPAGAAPVADGTLRLVHTGSFYGPRDPTPMLEGVERCLRARAGRGRPFRLRLVGAIGRRFDAALANFEARNPGVVERRPYVPHAEAVAEMRAADALLLVVGAGDGRQSQVVAGTLPGKLFEYLRSGQPVLLLGAAHGDAAALLRQHGRGWVADETDPAAIAEALARWLDGPPPSAPAGAQVARFERRALAGELASFFAQCQRRGAPGHG